MDGTQKKKGFTQQLFLQASLKSKLAMDIYLKKSKTKTMTLKKKMMRARKRMTMRRGQLLIP